MLNLQIKACKFERFYKASLLLVLISTVVGGCVKLSPAGEKVEVRDNDTNDARGVGCIYKGRVRGSKPDAVRNEAASMFADTIIIEQVTMGGLNYYEGRAYSCNGVNSPQERTAKSQQPQAEHTHFHPELGYSHSHETDHHHKSSDPLTTETGTEPTPPPAMERAKQTEKVSSQPQEEFEKSENLRKSRICHSRGGEWTNGLCILHIE